MCRCYFNRSRQSQNFNFQLARIQKYNKKVVLKIRKYKQFSLKKILKNNKFNGRVLTKVFKQQFKLTL